MPLFKYRCEECDTEVHRIHAPDADPQTCRMCGTLLVRAVSGPTTKVVETLDNGVMTKRLERLADAERLYADRAKRGRDEL